MECVPVGIRGNNKPVLKAGLILLLDDHRYLPERDKMCDGIFDHAGIFKM